MQVKPKVFLSHAHADNGYCDPIHAWIRYWGADCWYDRANMGHDRTLSGIIQDAIKASDVFLRVCTVPAQNSFYVTLERDMFVGLMAADHSHSRGGTRKLINLLVDPNYAVEPIDYAFAFIDATASAPAAWLEELRHAILGPTPSEEPAPSAPPLPITVEVPTPKKGHSSPSASSSARQQRLLDVVEFIDNDLGYLNWLTKHPTGYVLNCGKVPRPNYLMLHRATCHTISGTPTRSGPLHGMGTQGSVWTGAYMKACSPHRADLEEWASRKTDGGTVRPCFFCKP